MQPSFLAAVTASAPLAIDASVSQPSSKRFGVSKIGERHEAGAYCGRRLFGDVKPARLVAQDRIAAVGESRPAGLELSHQMRSQSNMRRARKIARKDGVDAVQPAIGVDRLKHLLQKLRADALTGAVRIIRPVRQQDRRQCDYLEAKPLPDEDRRRIADMAARHMR